MWKESSKVKAEGAKDKDYGLRDWEKDRWKQEDRFDRAIDDGSWGAETRGQQV